MNKMIIFAGIIFTVMLAGCAQNVQRFGSVIGVKEEKLDEYKKLHANPWPEINAKLKDVNIQNYSIYLTQFPDGKGVLNDLRLRLRRVYPWSYRGPPRSRHEDT